MKLIREGKPVALPTETVYGLAADALCPQAVRSIFTIKGRPPNDPLIVHVADFEQVERIAFAPSVLANLADAFWPGPLTVVLRKKDFIPDIVTSGLSTVAVRVSAHPLFNEILQAVDRPLAAPSANPFGYVSPTRAEHVVSSFGERSPHVLDGGPTDHGIESTILSLIDPGAPTILRPGPLSAGDLAEILGSPPTIQPICDDAVPQAPGNLKHHYSPNVSLQLHPDPATIRSEIEDCANPQSVGVLLIKRPSETENWPAGLKLGWLSEEGDLREVASRIYDALRKLDADPLIEIVHCQTPPEKDIGSAINDRLRRAAAQV